MLSDFGVVAGYDFVGDAFNADPASAAYNPIPVPDNNPDDCNGHGTHVSGIVGADGVVKGVAPGVKFGAYRVFGCEGSTTSDIMLAAMERALADGMHVLNMSIGAAFQWPQYPTAQAADRLVDKGMVVVTSIGNSGATGLYSASAPGVGQKVIGTASFDNVSVTLSTFTISPDNKVIGYAPATGAPLPPKSGIQQLARSGTAASTADACNSSPPAPGSLVDRVALIRRGTCSFYEKAFNAQNAGAIGVVLYNNVAGRINPTVAGAPPITIPVVSISDTEGVLIDSRLAMGPVSMTWTNEVGSFDNPTAGLISSFSSYGLAPDLSVKPDIGAPGGLIYSTYPLELGGYATISGTSMASPHVAGGVALLLQSKPKTPVQSVRTILQNSADPKSWWGIPNGPYLDNVHRQGAGMVDIDDSILATTRIEPGKISTGESQSGSFKQRLTVENKGTLDATYSLSFVNSLSTDANTFAPNFFLGGASVAFSSSSVTVPAGGKATVDATINPPTGPVNGLYGGYIVLTNALDKAKVFRVPFGGFVGDYQSIQVLVPTANGFPWLAKLSGNSFVNQPAGASYTMVGNDIPFFLVHLDHQSRRMEFQVLNAKTGKPVHPVFYNTDEFDYMPRNATPSGFFEFAWDGTRMHDRGKGTPDHRKVVPNGTYTIVMKVLKALGDPKNPAHWETWTSPPITVARP